MLLIGQGSMRVSTERLVARKYLSLPGNACVCNIIVKGTQK